MSIFGSRDDDPLLQNDPLAPSSDEEEESPAEENPSDESASSEAAPEPNAPEADASLFSNTEDANDSVFSRSDPEPSNGHEASHDAHDTRTITRSLSEIIDGRLPELNAALGQGWRLSQVEVRRGEGLDAASPLLAFLLRRPDK